MRLLLLTISIMLLLSPFVQGQEPVCGDANYDGALTIGDAVFIFNYLFNGGPPTAQPDPNFANWDEGELLTVNDVYLCINYMWEGYQKTGVPLLYLSGIGPNCSPGPPIVPSIDSNVVLLYSDRIPPGETQAEIAMTLYFGNYPEGFELPLNIRVDGQIPLIDSVSYFPQQQNQGGSSFPRYMIYPVSGEIAIGYNVIMEYFAPIDQICTIYLTVPESTEERPITVEWTRLTPIQSTVADSNCIYPMVIRYDQAFEPILTPTCCINAGDANDDGQVNLGDAVFLVAYCFKGGISPPCFSQGDTNVDGRVNIGDAIYMINYIFRDGPAPLCSLLQL
ncbi:MAG: dockerin type I repeat-containing protein [candidate division Zixibacteria bacterium]|nr:dockerin type I repeat-containing protein [candidate division Zixibacteria bacterium]